MTLDRDNQKRGGRGCWLLTAGVAACLSLIALPALATQDGRDIIGPYEYDLPVNFQPFNVFVQYGDYGINNNTTWNGNGDRVSGLPSQELVGLSKYVRFWSPTPTIGVAYEIVVPEVGIRTPATATSPGSSVGGISDPLTGPAIWIRPVNGKDFSITLGYDFLVQVPIGDSAVGGGQTWHLNSAFLYNIDYYNWNFVGDIGVVAALSTDAQTGVRPGLHYYTDDDLAYKVASHFAPFVGITHEFIEATPGSVLMTLSGPVTTPRTPAGWETLANVGAFFPYSGGKQSITVRYSYGVAGVNHAATNEFGLKYAVVW